MAKLTSYNGKATGKQGSTVYAVNSGVQIAREYNPNVSNPSTSRQVNQRSKFKLMSQLSAAMEAVIVIPKKGLVSKRNAFVAKNIGLCTSVNGEASVSYENLQITAGNAAIPGIKIERAAATGIALSLLEDASQSVSRVVYSVFKKNSEAELQLLDSIVVDEAGENGTFPTTMDYVAGELVVYAYGMKDTSAKATAKYRDYHVATGVDIANLVGTRTIGAGDARFTSTRGTTLFQNEDENTTAGALQSMVYISAIGAGSVSSQGFSNGRKAVDNGTSITITATPDEGATFLGWRNNGENTYFSTTNPLTLTISSQRDIVGVFNNPNAGGGGDVPGGDE